MAELKTNFTKIRNGKTYLTLNMSHCMLPSVPDINVNLEYMRYPQELVI